MNVSDEILIQANEIAARYSNIDTLPEDIQTRIDDALALTNLGFAAIRFIALSSVIPSSEHHDDIRKSNSLAEAIDGPFVTKSATGEYWVPQKGRAKWVWQAPSLSVEFKEPLQQPPK